MSCSIFMLSFLSFKSSNQSILHPKYLLINTNSSAFGTTLLLGSSQAFILVTDMPVNMDRYILDFAVDNRVYRLWNGGLFFLVTINLNSS